MYNRMGELIVKNKRMGELRVKNKRMGELRVKNKRIGELRGGAGQVAAHLRGDEPPRIRCKRAEGCRDVCVLSFAAALPPSLPSSLSASSLV